MERGSGAAHYLVVDAQIIIGEKSQTINKAKNFELKKEKHK
jgi:hypothetical protein